MTGPTVRPGLELLPCPFCGGPAERFTIEEEGDNFGGDVISCTKCGASSHVEFGRKENLVSVWNTRPALAASWIEEMREALRNMIRLADMGFEESMREPEENGNYVAYTRAKAALSLADGMGGEG
jgi:Lar family restriction alleviation protein